ncbi:MAG: hypothetical protein A2655_04205 [Candidatus Yanofskybacteria bacterium RIFCSPHIGHO2_01_FULL_43_42]|uniref:Restriction endonuclease n=1 Tax=Candidatus Yanofskybacteria bacterium RIFCSPLOWO2_01_FULL_43_22 TaxID=1802695 RepID=A0A1F8GF12_9BACT|nr:MAG: hypothetical protein A2655_04205 [Candidatus Yanofskybacteria bacterium RIFCSPHIGHO2_01_FULL_43_42]OGN12696.1 MAG: hypothetical protein A3D48_01555 [Candidatus Yanofskybacteria bacterium RIFCSPHIGHO2_02_FULL_43_17]OGN23318.1 MAG: hypothetical protein A3A13_04325 [Candidatus Yanofskybacteria bacterium RIFCSPLOWO2_01_FULL_43_22]
MPETIRSDPPQEKFNTDKERLEFLEKRIVERVQSMANQVRDEFEKDLEARTQEPDIDSENQSQTHEKRRQKLKKGADFYKTTKLNILKGLGDLRRELEQSTRFGDYIPELNALIDAVRTIYLSQLKVKHKEYRVMTEAPQLSDEEITEQERLTEDMTESRSLVQWYVIQNESNPDYLTDLFNVFRNIMSRLGFESNWRGAERGLRQELGVFKILSKCFKKVIPGNPKEDAHYAIDFWAKTNNGTNVIFQSKSSFVRLDDGIYGEEQISDLEKELSASPIASIRYQKDLSGQEMPTSDLVKVKKLQQDIKKAKEYAQSQGIDNPHFYLIVSRADKYKEITGEPDSQATKSIENDLWQISTLF